METASDHIAFGPCCACGKTDGEVRNIIVLDRLCPTPGKGWGCLQCGLPYNGATAVLCDTCLEANAEIKFVCSGFVADGGRIAIDDYPYEKFKHRVQYHPELLRDLRWFDESPDFGHPECICSVCGDQIPWPEEDGEGYDPAAPLPLRLFRPASEEHPHGQEARFCVDCVPLAISCMRFSESEMKDVN